MIRKLLATTALCVVAAQGTAAQDWDHERHWRNRDGVQIRIGRNYVLPADQMVTWPVVVIGGSATIDGRVEDDLVVIGGPVRIGPQAQVRANVVAIGGEVRVADTAQVSGEIHDVSVLWPEIRLAVLDGFWNVDRDWWAALSLAGTMLRFTLVLVATCLLALVAPGWIRRSGFRVADAPLAAGFVGLAAEVLIIPVFVIVIAGLILTIVGIPLLILVPFAALALIVAWVVGFAGVAGAIGRRLRGGTRVSVSDSPVADVAWGVVLLFVLPFASKVLALAGGPFWPLSTAFGLAGFVIEYLVWTVGLGAVLLAPLDRRWQVPPVPSTVPPQSPNFGTTHA